MSLVMSVPVAVDAADSARGLREASPYPADHCFAVCKLKHFIPLLSPFQKFF